MALGQLAELRSRYRCQWQQKLLWAAHHADERKYKVYTRPSVSLTRSLLRLPAVAKQKKIKNNKGTILPIAQSAFPPSRSALTAYDNTKKEYYKSLYI